MIKRILNLSIYSLLALPATCLACPICNDAWANGGGGEGMGFGRGLYFSLLLMLGMLIGLVTALVTYMVRRSSKPLPSWVLREQEGVLQSSKSRLT